MKQIQEAYRVLSPNSKAIFTIWCEKSQGAAAGGQFGSGGAKSDNFVRSMMSAWLDPILAEQRAAKKQFDYGISKIYRTDKFVTMLKHAGFSVVKKWNQACSRFVKSGEEIYENDHKAYVRHWAKKLGLTENKVASIRSGIIEKYEEIFKEMAGPHVQVCNLYMYLVSK